MRKELQHAVSRAEGMDGELRGAKAHIYGLRKNQMLLQGQLRMIVHVLRNRMNDLAFDLQLHQGLGQCWYTVPPKYGEPRSRKDSAYSPSVLFSGQSTAVSVGDSGGAESRPLAPQATIGAGVLGLTFAPSELSPSPVGFGTLAAALHSPQSMVSADQANNLNGIDGDSLPWVLNRSGAASVPPSIFHSTSGGIEESKYGAIGIRHPSNGFVGSSAARAVSDPLTLNMTKAPQKFERLGVERETRESIIIITPMTDSTPNSPSPIVSNSPFYSNALSTQSRSTDKEERGHSDSGFNVIESNERTAEGVRKMAQLICKLEKLVEQVNTPNPFLEQY